MFEVSVFDAIKSFVADLANNDGQSGGLGDDEFHVAYAALLVHAAAIDGAVSETERDKLKNLLMQRFDLDDAAAADLVARATDADERAVDLYHFTRLLNERLDEPGRLRMIETMWTVAYADGAPSDYENNLIWRVADLLGVSQAERVALRQRAAASRGDPA
jgi:uncharacterized tellurite resistance protein B-like protein